MHCLRQKEAAVPQVMEDILCSGPGVCPWSPHNVCMLHGQDQGPVYDAPQVAGTMSLLPGVAVKQSDSFHSQNEL